jgi:hypothetical protein
VSEPASPDADLGAQVAGSFARHLGSYVAGLLVACGAIQHDQQGAAVGIVSSLVLYGIAQGWSLWRKWRRARGAS